METWDAIRARRNVRQYTGQSIARESLERVCEAGRRAPSAGNWQPWKFVVITVREQLIELAKVWDRGGRHIPSSAATIALVAKEEERQGDWLMYDFGQATAYMMLAAADLGIGSGQEDKTARCGGEGVAAAADGQLALQDVEALILAVMDMQGRPGPDAGLQDAQGPARRTLRRLQAWIACQVGATWNHIASPEVGHGSMITRMPAPGACAACR